MRGSQLPLLILVHVLKSLQERVERLLGPLLPYMLPLLHDLINKGDPKGGGTGADRDAAEGIWKAGAGGAQRKEGGFVEIEVLARGLGKNPHGAFEGLHMSGCASFQEGHAIICILSGTKSTPPNVQPDLGD